MQAPSWISYFNTTEEFYAMPRWARWVTGIILAQVFVVFNLGLYLLGSYYKGGWILLCWLATIIFFGVYVNNFQLPKNKVLIVLGLFLLPAELAVMLIFLNSPWQFVMLDWYFAEIVSFTTAFAIGGFIKGWRLPHLALAALAFGGLLTFALVSAFLKPLRASYGETPDYYWLLLLVPTLTAFAERTHMFISDVNIGESVLAEKLQPLFVTWVLGSIFGYIIYAGVCT